MIQSPRGADDILPPESARLRALEQRFIETASRFGYREIRTPIFEEAALFEKGTGETTDLVTKEMYVFSDRGGRTLALRPEGTPPIVRAAVQHHLLKQNPYLKASYAGPMFRYERPQRGRGRQFHQAGVEFIGVSDPLADAEVIHLLVSFLSECGVSDYRVLLNNLGCTGDRATYRAALTAFLIPHIQHLSRVDQERFSRNPFRVLDSKEPETQRFLAERTDLPCIADHLCASCREHNAGVLTALGSLCIPYEETPTLVRGLDYYERTVFEVVSSRLGAQDAIGGGGRYDHIFTSIGFKEDYPAVGFAIGLERLLLASVPAGSESGLHFLVIPIGESARGPAFRLVARLRQSLAVDLAWGISSLRAALRSADRQKTPFVGIIGDEELRENVLILRNMKTGEQMRLSLDDPASLSLLIQNELQKN
ncbi:MAG: histidine--tRNA ligase [bacterium JZ-2024 1]